MTILHKIVIAGLIFFAVISVFLTIPTESNYRTGADEGTYYSYATFLAKHGLGAFPGIAKAYVSSYGAQLQPTPIRVGHILATVLWFKALPETYVSLARFSFFCFVVFIIISFLYCRRHFGADVAYIFAMLLSSSPLMMAMGRRALSDMHGNLWCGLVLWLFLDFLRDKKKLTYCFLLLAYSMAILVRESSLVLGPFLFGVFLLSKYVYRNEIKISYLFGIVVVPAFIVVSVYCLVFGPPVALSLFATLFKVHGDSGQASQYATQFCSGPWFRYLIDFISMSPVTVLLFLAYAGWKLVQRDGSWPSVYFGLYFCVTYAVFGSLEYSKIVRAVMSLETVIVLFAALCLWELFRQKKNEYQARIVLVSAIVIFFMNYSAFTDIFCVKDVYDPVTYDLLSTQKMIP